MPDLRNLRFRTLFAYVGTVTFSQLNRNSAAGLESWRLPALAFGSGLSGFPLRDLPPCFETHARAGDIFKSGVNRRGQTLQQILRLNKWSPTGKAVAPFSTPVGAES